MVPAIRDEDGNQYGGDIVDAQGWRLTTTDTTTEMPSSPHVKDVVKEFKSLAQFLLSNNLAAGVNVQFCCNRREAMRKQ